MTLPIEPSPRKRSNGGLKAPAWLRIVRSTAQLPRTPFRVRSPEDVARLLGPTLAVEEVERYLVVILDSQSYVRGVVEISRGIMNSTLAHPREAFRVAIIYGAAGVLMVHNHPSGDPTPSPEDRIIAKQMSTAGDLLNIPVFDHIILGANRFTSFATQGIL